MKLLQLCKKVPYPLKDGESIAIHYLSKGLTHAGCDLSLLAINTKKHFVEIKNTPEALNHYKRFKTIYFDNTIKPLDVIVNVFKSSSYNIERFLSRMFEEALIEWLQEESYDVILLETLYMAAYIPIIKQYSTAKIVMRSHNIEHEIWTNLSAGSTHLLKKYYYRLCADRLEKFEQDAMNDYDLLLPISDIDRQKYTDQGYTGAYHVTPIGIDTSKYQVSSSSSLNMPSIFKIGYIGSLDWKPNVEGLDWFFSEVWHDISEEHVDVEFHLAGRNMADNFKSIKKDKVVIHGEVEDALAFIRSLDLMIVPLFSGSGIRVKIIESMAMGIAVLSTPKGYEGIGVESGINGVIFRDKDELLQGLRTIKESIELRELIREEGRNLVVQCFDYNIIGKSLMACFSDRLLSEV